MIKYRIGRPYVRRLKNNDIACNADVQQSIDYLRDPGNHLNHCNAYAICGRGQREVFLVSLSKRHLMKIMREAESLVA